MVSGLLPVLSRCESLSQTSHSLCSESYHGQIRSFVHNFYQFIEGVSQHHRNIDDLLSKVWAFHKSSDVHTYIPSTVLR